MIREGGLSPHVRSFVRSSLQDDGAIDAAMGNYPSPSFEGVVPRNLQRGDQGPT